MSKKPTVDSLIYEDLGNCHSCPHNKKKKKQTENQLLFREIRKTNFHNENWKDR